MCMEDIRVMRQTRVVTSVRHLDATAREFVPYARDRVGIIICAPVAGTMFISTIPGFTGVKGLQIRSNTNPVEFTLMRNGAFVIGPIYALLNGASIDVAYIEIFLPVE